MGGKDLFLTDLNKIFCIRGIEIFLFNLYNSRYSVRKYEKKIINRSSSIQWIIHKIV